ncbi:MAG: hypothetical protein GKR89_34225 [Candidatus Latescibacteria bacterium]|nr:hypothetical protein [Candidatus Latescibacterota bacterium]
MALGKNGWTRASIEDALARNDPDEMLRIPILVGLDPPDCSWAQSLCRDLAHHSDPRVRGNALLGFGHLARTCCQLDRPTVYPLLAAGLTDKLAAIRRQATAAAMDIEQYLGWTFAPPSPHC